ncbi:MAG: ABC transporter ATP-binding protein [Spirochaeta sp.]|jgi:ABC-type sugar transport system ATPase subunit|nr:ABC transporter ATP-binding protein [Spirochaeta sp.]
MSGIRTEKLTKMFGTLAAVDDLTFDFADGKVTCLLGPSGCGKTTLLRMIAGLETPTGGRVFFGDREVTDLSPRDRNIGMVFQYPVVYRGMTVEENVAAPLKAARIDRPTIAARTEEVLSLLELRGRRDVPVESLSSVERQKVAVAREVARKPSIILFDEPMTNVDSASKLAFKRSFKILTQEINQTIVYVTHDQTEAMTLADRIALMEEGRIAQYNDPRTLYNEPEDTFAGWFLGNPGMTFLPARVERNGQAFSALLRDVNMRLPITGGVEEGQKVTVGIRPEKIGIFSAARDGSVRVGLRRSSVTTGGQLLLELDANGFRFKAKIGPELRGTVQGDSVWVGIDSRDARIFNEDGALIRQIATTA